MVDTDVGVLMGECEAIKARYKCNPFTIYPQEGSSRLLPVMMAGSIQLAVFSQQLTPEPTPPKPTPSAGGGAGGGRGGPAAWLTPFREEDEDEDEEDEEEEGEELLGRPPKLMLMLGRSARSPSCHSLTLRPSSEPLCSARRHGGHCVEYVWCAYCYKY